MYIYTFRMGHLWDLRAELRMSARPSYPIQYFWTTFFLWQRPNIGNIISTQGYRHLPILYMLLLYIVYYKLFLNRSDKWRPGSILPNQENSETNSYEKKYIYFLEYAQQLFLWRLPNFLHYKIIINPSGLCNIFVTLIGGNVSFVLN